MSTIPVSATLAANEILIRKRRAGEPVLPLSFGEAGLPVHPLLKTALAAAAGRNAYGPVAGQPALREAAAGYWTRRSLPTTPETVIAGRAPSRCCSACCWPSARMSPCPSQAG